MSRRAFVALLMWPGVVLAGVDAVTGPGRTPQELVAAVEEASHTEGFRLRATVTRTAPGPELKLRLQMAGLKDAGHQILFIRALAPQAWLGRAVVLEAGPGRTVRALAYASRDAKAGRAADPQAPLFNAGLVPWDFMGEWWRWPVQVRVRDEALLGRDCVVVDSRGGRSPVARVRSWISPDLRMPLRLEFYGSDGVLLRAIRMEHVFRRADGSGAARTLLLVDADGATSRFEVYNGEDGVALAPGEFSAQGAAEAPEPQVSP